MNDDPAILLISAGRSSFQGAMWGACDLELPLNMASAAAVLEQCGHRVALLDVQVAPVDPWLAAERLGRLAMVGISANLANAAAVGRLARRLRQAGFEGLLFVFGPLGLYLKSRLLSEIPHVDVVVHGEEEPTILDLAASGHDPSGVAGTCGRRDGRLWDNRPRPYLEDLDRLPFPARHKLPVERYFPAPGKYLVLPQFTLLSSRGCDYHCLFCEKTGGRRLRARSPENIAAEIDELVGRFGAREIAFVDEMFGADPGQASQLAGLLARRPYRVRLRISTRLDHLDFGVLADLKRVGLYSVGFGIESGDDRVLAFNRKRITTDQVRRVVARVRRLGLETRGYFMINMPGETRASVGRTEAFIRELRLDLVNVQIAYPFPGTPFRRLVRRNYRVLPERWRRWECSDGDDVVFLQADLSETFLLENYRRIIRTNYFTPRFVGGWLRRIRTWHDFKYSTLAAWNLARALR